MTGYGYVYCPEHYNIASFQFGDEFLSRGRRGEDFFFFFFFTNILARGVQLKLKVNSTLIKEPPKREVWPGNGALRILFGQSGAKHDRLMTSKGLETDDLITFLARTFVSQGMGAALSMPPPPLFGREMRHFLNINQMCLKFRLKA